MAGIHLALGAGDSISVSMFRGVVSAGTGSQCLLGCRWQMSFIMSFERHDEFWIKSYFGKVFHVMSVGEGLAAITVLSLATCVAVRWLRR
jgi:hypothetical protein